MSDRQEVLWCYTHRQEFVWAGRETCLGFDAMTLYGTVCDVRVKVVEQAVVDLDQELDELEGEG